MKPGLMCEKCVFFEPIDYSVAEDLGLCRRHAPAPMTFRDSDESEEGLMASSLFPVVDARIDWCGEHSDFDRTRSMAAGQ